MVDNVKRINDLILKENFEDGPEAGYYIHDMTKPDDPEAPMDNMIGPMAELDEVIDYQWRQPPEKTKWAGLFYYDDGWYFVFPVMEDGVMVDIDLVRSSRSGLNVSRTRCAGQLQKYTNCLDQIVCLTQVWFFKNYMMH